MQQHNGKYPRIKCVSWSLGTNDILHQSQHRLSERSRYLKLLYVETKRIFPQAEVIFILPFNGMEKVSSAYIRELASDIKANCPYMKILHPPSMRQKLGRDGIHLNRQGKHAYLGFLQKHLGSNPRARVNSVQSDHGFRVTQPINHMSHVHSYAEVARANNTSYQMPRVRMDSGTPNEHGPVNIQQATVQQSHFPGYLAPVTPGFISVPEHSQQNARSHGQLVNDISEALAYVMRLGRQGSQPPNYPRHSGLQSQCY